MDLMATQTPQFDFSGSPAANIDLDNSSGAMITSPAGNTYRGIGASWFNAENVAKEDWLRDQQAQQNSFMRDMYQMQEANAFTASQNQLNRDFESSEAQKARDWQENMTKNSYKIAVDSMREAGLNPVLAYQQGGASTPSGATARASGSTSSSSPSRGGSGYRPESHHVDPLNGIVRTVARLVGTYISGKINLQAGIARDSAKLDKMLSNSLSLESAKHANDMERDFERIRQEFGHGSKKYWQDWSEYDRYK